MNRKPLLLIPIVFFPALASAVPPTFTDVTMDAGMVYMQSAPPPSQDFFEEARMTGGAAAGDYDGDGWVDLFVTRIDNTDILYRNLGNGTFVDASVDAGFTNTHHSNGAAWGDIDNDGDLDLYLTSLTHSDGGRFYLYINDGLGHFTEQAQLRGAAVARDDNASGFSATFGDYDRDGYLDLHTTDWGIRHADMGDDPPSYARLLRNQGTAAPGFFEDTTNAAGVSLSGVTTHGVARDPEGAFSFSSRLADMDHDGWPDLVIAGDFQTSRLFWNNGDGTFTDGTDEAGVGSDENGMGSTVADYDGDGDLDWFVTSIYDPANSCDDATCNWGVSGNRLYRNDGQRQFSDQTDAAGVRDGGWGWGAALFDYDNDRDLDLVMTNGIDFNSTTEDAPYVADPMRLWQNDGNDNPVFAEVAQQEGITDTGSGKGLLTLDYDNDGDLDLFVVNNAGAGVLYRNNTDGAATWLQVDTVGTISNRDGIGARILVDPNVNLTGDEQIGEVNAGSHYLAQSEFTAHFGLGTLAGTIDRIEIEWPSGVVQELTDVVANQLIIATEPMPGDFDLNGLVNGHDFVLWQAGFGQDATGISASADGDADGDVDANDFLIWRSNYGRVAWAGSTEGMTIPEPGTSILLAIALFAWRVLWDCRMVGRTVGQQDCGGPPTVLPSTIRNRSCSGRS